MSQLCRLALLTTTLLALGGCERCGGSEHVAELRETTRTVDRDYDASRETWGTAEVGARFALGDGVRTGSEARAVLALGRDGAAQLRLEESTTIRFLSRPGDEPGALVDVTMARLWSKRGTAASRSTRASAPRSSKVGAGCGSRPATPGSTSRC